MEGRNMSLTEEELRKLSAECRKLPEGIDPRVDDYITNLFLTVLDFRMRVELVDSAIAFYKENRRSELSTHQVLAEIISWYPNTKKGNTKLANYLWNNNHWTRVKFLRELLKYFRGRKVRDMSTLSAWARSTDFQDVKGRIKTKEHSVGYALFRWLQIRSGVDTVKPDVHVKKFVSECIGRKSKNEETVEAIEMIAKELQIPAFRLDAAVWLYQRDQSIQKRQELMVSKRRPKAKSTTIIKKGGQR